MMIGGRVLPSVRHKRAYRAYEPDIDRAAEGLSRAASAAGAGAADAGVRARHRTRRRHHGRHLCARTIAQGRAPNRRGGAAAHRRSGAAIVQHAAADAICKIAAPMPGGDKQRGLARVGSPNVIEDLLPIGSVLQAREALDTLNSRLPRFLRMFADQQIASVGASLNVPSLQKPQLLPFALSLVMQRLTAPWQIIRLAI